jgi:hypothetical protein
MSDLAKELGAGSLTGEQVDAITHAWLDLCASKKEFEFLSEWQMTEARELAVACRDSVEELEKAFPFLLEGVEDE